MNNPRDMIACPVCGRDVFGSEIHCRFCGASLLSTSAGAGGSPFAEISPYAPPLTASQPVASGDDSLLQWVIPVGRSPYAIVAEHCGLLSLGCALLGPLGIIFGALAIRDIRRRPGLTGLPRAILGIVLGTLGTLLLVLFVLAMVLG